MNKRDAVLSVLDGSSTQEHIPAAFFLHFNWWCRHFTPAAVRKHMEFFRSTGMDFMKIQYEKTFPHSRKIRRPQDWTQMPLYSKRFFAGQLEIARRLVREAKREALVIMTVYSPFMCAGHTVGDGVITEHLEENPDQVARGMEIITESLLGFVKECVRIGVDGFYAASQGGEAHRFSDSTIFEKYIKPFDLALMQEMEGACQFNILHVCDHHGGYDDLSPFYDYPGHVVSCSLKRGEERTPMREVSQNFRRPYMGGMDNRELWISGTEAEVIRATERCLDNAPDRFILGADCTLPGEVGWDTIRAAISAAHCRPTSSRRD
jgi:uroporphyrinogen decarboxylase